LLQNYIFFGKNQSPVIEIYKKTSLSRISSYQLTTVLSDSGGTGVTDMAMFAPGLQPSTTSKSVGVKR